METPVAIVWILMVILDWVTAPIFWLREMFTWKRLPPISDDLLKASATKLAEMIRKKRITSEKVVQSYIKRIREVNPVLNAIVEDRFQDAIEDARAVDNMLKDTTLTEEELKRKRPLLGVPVTVKESCCLKGLSYSVGSLRYKGRKADADGEAVTKLKIAGAIPLLVSSTPELCFGWEASNHITGVTKNPYNPAYSSAGSSGGEGALLGAGASVIGIGSDIAGSIRLPALFNGIFGHKPTPRVISIKGHFPSSPGKENFSAYLVIGPMTRYAEDLPLLTTVLCDDPSVLKLDEKDKRIAMSVYYTIASHSAAFTYGVSGGRASDDVDLSSLKIFSVKNVSDGWLYPSISDEIGDAIDKSAKHFEEIYGVNTRSKRFDGLEEIFDMGLSLIIEASENAPNLLKNPNNKDNEQNPWAELLKSMVLMSDLTLSGSIFQLARCKDGFMSKDKVQEFAKKAANLKQEITKELGTNGVIFVPSFTSAAFRSGQALVKARGFLYLMISNILGLPSTQIPTGLNRKGLPIGFQVVAAPYQDRLCLAVAKELEKRFGGWIAPN